MRSPAILQRAGLWLPPMLLAAAIFVLSGFSEVPGIDLQAPGLDKIAHLLEYALLAFLMLRILQESCVRLALPWAWALTTLYGLSDEIHQYVVPGRSSDPFDLAVDAIGALCGGLLFYALTGQLFGNRSR